jgi:hypothetical protein
MNMKKALDVRVFKRNTSILVLLWSKVAGLEEKDIEVLCKKIGSERFTPVEFGLNLPEEFKDLTHGEKPKEEDTIVCVIFHDKNGIDPDSDCLMQVKYGAFEQFQKVYRVGIKPDFEREMPEKNVHLMGWDTKKSRWRKVDLVECGDGTYAIPVKLIDDTKKK